MNRRRRWTVQFSCLCFALLAPFFVRAADGPPPMPIPALPGGAAPPDLGELLHPLPLSPMPPLPSGGDLPKPNRAPLSADAIATGSSPIAQVLGSTTEGTTTRAYTVTHLRATEMQALLADPNAPLLSRETSTVTVDARSNTLVIRGTEADHQMVENLLRRIDAPVKQVLLEVKIISADEYFGKSLGARLGITSSHMLNAATPRQGGAQVGGTLADLNTIAATGASNFPNMVSLPATNMLTSAPVSTFAVGIYKLPAGINIGLEISALEEEGHTQVLSSPRLVLSNFKPATLSSGQRIPYSKPSLVQGVSTTEFVDAKVSVSVTALVAPDGSISMDLALTNDTVGSNSSIGPTINTNQVTSNVTLNSGETLLLGGFQSSSQSEDANKTPVLADLPVVGGLFRNKSRTAVKRELLFIITPSVIGAGT